MLRTTNIALYLNSLVDSRLSNVYMMNTVLFWRPRKKILSFKNIQKSLTFNIQLKVEADVWMLLLVTCWYSLLYFSWQACSGLQSAKEPKAKSWCGCCSLCMRLINLVSNILSLTLCIMPGSALNKEFLSVLVSLFLSLHKHSIFSKMWSTDHLHQLHMSGEIGDSWSRTNEWESLDGRSESSHFKKNPAILVIH